MRLSVESEAESLPNSAQVNCHSRNCFLENLSREYIIMRYGKRCGLGSRISPCQNAGNRVRNISYVRAPSTLPSRSRRPDFFRNHISTISWSKGSHLACITSFRSTRFRNLEALSECLKKCHRCIRASMSAYFRERRSLENELCCDCRTN